MSNTRDLSTQESVHSVIGSGSASATTAAFGAALKTVVPRGVSSTVSRAFKVTYANGTRARRYFLAGVEYPHNIVGISTTNGSAISSTSMLVTPCY